MNRRLGRSPREAGLRGWRVRGHHRSAMAKRKVSRIFRAPNMTMPLERGFWRLTLVVSLAALAAGFVLIGLLAADLLDETSNKKLVEWWMKHLWVPGVPFVFWWAPVVAQNNPLLIGVVLSQA